MYLLGTLAEARVRGWAADVLIFRTCNGEMNRARRLYHSGETTDLDFVVRRLVAARPTQPLVLAGFSLGGNVLLSGSASRGRMFRPGFAAPRRSRFLSTSSCRLPTFERGFARVYGRHFLRTLRAKAHAKLRAFPDCSTQPALDRARTLFDFDDAVTAPVHGFRDAGDYSTRSSSINFLAAIRRPTLLLSAVDDPFLPPEVLDSVFEMARSNPDLILEFHELGGHVGFVSGRNPLHPHYYAEWRVVDFLDELIRQPEAQTLRKRKPA